MHENDIIQGLTWNNGFRYTMKYFTTLALTLASVATADWALYCGDSVSSNQNPQFLAMLFSTPLTQRDQCTDGTLVASGSEAELSCTSLGGTYDYCYILADSIYYVDWWKAIFTENIDCIISGIAGGRESKGLYNGSCTEAGSWKSYEVVINA
jgi:hypothetical protein